MVVTSRQSWSQHMPLPQNCPQMALRLDLLFLVGKASHVATTSLSAPSVRRVHMCFRFQQVLSDMTFALRLPNILRVIATSTATIAMIPLAFADVSDGLSALDTGDIATAASAFQDGFAAGDADGAFYLGRLFEFGLGTEVDMARAANLYAAGAEAGSVLAMNRLALMYLDGAVLLRDYAEASRLFCDSAELGDVTGQLNCGLMYQAGRGVTADAGEAMRYLELAAAQDNIAAQNVLGQMLVAGEGVPADPDRARALFMQTALAGNAVGLFELARSYADEGDLVQAYAYANLATVRGHVAARALRDTLEAQMSGEQIAAAQEQAKVWTASRISEQAVAQTAPTE